MKIRTSGLNWTQHLKKIFETCRQR